MVKVKTFGQVLKIFETARELVALDEEVNKFIADNKVTNVISVSDAIVASDGGATQGIIRVMAYE